MAQNEVEAPSYNQEPDYEDQMPTHVVWGKVLRGGEGHRSSPSGSSRRGSSKSETADNSDGSYPGQIVTVGPDGRRQFHAAPSRPAPTAGGAPLSSAILAMQAGYTAQSSEMMPGGVRSEDSGDNICTAEGEPILPLGQQEQQQQQQQGQGQVGSPLALSPEELAKVMAQVRYDETGEATSLGSAKHEDACKPCLFVHSKVGCFHGVLCRFCHFKHVRGSKPRPCKGKRNRYKNLIGRMEIQRDDPEGEGGDPSVQ